MLVYIVQYSIITFILTVVNGVNYLSYYLVDPKSPEEEEEEEERMIAARRVLKSPLWPYFIILLIFQLFKDAFPKKENKK